MTRRKPLQLDALEARALLSGLSDSLTTDRADYRPGQPIVMDFQETNVSSQPITVEDGPSLDGFSVSHGGNVIWRSNAGINPLFVRQETLQPGQSLTLTATWDGIPAGASAPATGQFVITNELDGGAATATVTISSSASPAAPSPANPAPGPPASATATAPGPTASSGLVASPSRTSAATPLQGGGLHHRNHPGGPHAAARSGHHHADGRAGAARRSAGGPIGHPAASARPIRLTAAPAGPAALA